MVLRSGIRHCRGNNVELHQYDTALTTSWSGGSNNVAGAFWHARSISPASGDLYDVALPALTGAQNMNLFGDSTLTNDWGYTGLTGGNTTFAGRLSLGTDAGNDFVCSGRS